jgi:hypothetical protein
MRWVCRSNCALGLVLGALFDLAAFGAIEPLPADALSRSDVGIAFIWFFAAGGWLLASRA